MFDFKYMHFKFNGIICSFKLSLKVNRYTSTKFCQMNKLTLLFVALLLSLFACTEDPADQPKDDRENIVRVHYKADPDKLNPMNSRTGYATRTHDLMFQTLVEADPFTLELEPMLVKDLAKEEAITEGKYKGGYSYSYEILDEAVWDNGSPVTGYDYAFTLKAVYNPKVNASVWRSYLSFIKDVEVDESNPKKFKVITDEFYMAAAYTCGAFYVFPQYKYDPKGLMTDFKLSDLTNADNVKELEKNEPKLQEFATEFQSTEFAHDPALIGGSGPYKLSEWTIGKSLVLTKKENWWGNKLAKKYPLLTAYPSKIIAEPIPDEATAITKLKDGAFDAMNEISPEAFMALKENELAKKQFNFFTPELMQYYFFVLNNKNPKLEDKRVRKALTHLLNKDKAIETVMLGMGKKTDGPFHPTKPYYNKSLKPIAFNVESAKSLLAEAGWKDTDSNGTVDKVINGQKTELDLTVFVTKNPIGKETALIWKEDAKKAGVNLEVVEKDFRQLIGNEIRKREFDISVYAIGQSATVDDPYQRWHSSNNTPDGSNHCGFENEEADKLIVEIRETKDPAKRNEKYMRFQEIIYDECPVIFLFAPTERIVINKKYDTKATLRRPGFFANLFKLR